jgi:hypothetical protein
MRRERTHENGNKMAGEIIFSKEKKCLRQKKFSTTLGEYLWMESVFQTLRTTRAENGF